jgi:hypothetical protein
MAASALVAAFMNAYNLGRTVNGMVIFVMMMRLMVSATAAFINK